MPMAAGSVRRRCEVTGLLGGNVGFYLAGGMDVVNDVAATGAAWML